MGSKESKVTDRLTLSPHLSQGPNLLSHPSSPTGPLAQNGYGAGTDGLGEAGVGVLELQGGPSPAPHFPLGFGGGVNTQKPGEPQPRLCLCPPPGVCGPLPPHLHLHLSPPDLGTETAWELSQVSGGIGRITHAGVLPRPHEGRGMIEGCWEETPRIPAFWLDFHLSRTPNPPSSPFLSPQAQQYHRDTERVGAEGSLTCPGWGLCAHHLLPCLQASWGA